MTDAQSSWINIGFCDCEEYCPRWGIREDGTSGFFTPYVPENVESDTNKCKKLCHLRGKNIKPTVIRD